MKARTDPGRTAKTADGEAGPLDAGQGSEPAMRIGGADALSKRGEGGEGAQAASPVTSASIASSVRMSARHSLNAR